MMNEEWRDVVGYEGYYQVSNLGRVKSLERIDSNNHPLKERILKFGFSGKKYKYVILNKNGKSKTKTVHRLVAIAFLDNPDNKTQVNHLDEDKYNNNANNLEWVTPKENSNYGTLIERMKQSNSKPIKVIYKDDTYEIWESATLFAREYGISRGHISNVLVGRNKSHHGLRFEYV